VPRTMSGRYVKATDTYCDYTITFLNCDTDDEGFIVGAGEYLNLVLLTEHKVPMDINTIVGTYDVVMPVAGAVYEKGKYIGGTMFKRGGTTYPVGSYYKEFDGQGGEAFGLFNGGTITVTQNNGDITFKGNWKTPEGKTVKMEYTGNVSKIIDQSQQQEKPAARISVRATITDIGIELPTISEALISPKNINKTFIIQRKNLENKINKTFSKNK